MKVQFLLTSKMGQMCANLRLTILRVCTEVQSSPADASDVLVKLKPSEPITKSISDLVKDLDPAMVESLDYKLVDEPHQNH